MLLLYICALSASLSVSFENHRKNGTYISKTTQNDIIQICGQFITDNIVKKIDGSKFFSLIGNETTDCAHREQLCICVRFVVAEGGIHKVKEEFLEFSEATDLTGYGVAKKILECLKERKLDIRCLVGQG